MSISDKKVQEKICNCKNSKCIKLYCQCFAAQRHCGKNCRCINCHNTVCSDPFKSFKDSRPNDQKIPKEDIIKNHKGCACRKSGCTKKYCECFQAGLTCTDLCKCVECQNNQSLANKMLINHLKKNRSDASNISGQLYPLYLSQNSDQLHNIIIERNPLCLKENWLEGCAKQLYESAQNSSSTEVLDSFILILKNLEQSVTPFTPYSVKKQGSNECSSIEEGMVKKQSSQDKLEMQVKQQFINKNESQFLR